MLLESTLLLTKPPCIGPEGRPSKVNKIALGVISKGFVRAVTRRVLVLRGRWQWKTECCELLKAAMNGGIYLRGADVRHAEIELFAESCNYRFAGVALLYQVPWAARGTWLI
jgi:hypothetical protein